MVDITQNDLLVELRRVANVVDQSPTEKDMLAHGAYAYSAYFRYFESWTRAKELAGVPLTSPGRVNDEELISELKRVRNDVGETPTRREIDEMGDYPSSTYKYRFGSWNDALKEAGLAVNEPSPGSGEKGYGPNWRKYREQVLKRDDRACRVCGIRATDLDVSLHVHHITPLREFDDESGSIDFEAAHSFENLVTLCPSCHAKCENLYTSSGPQEFSRSVRQELSIAEADS